MKNRAIMVILITCLVLSTGFNIVLFQKLNKTISNINTAQNYVNEKELNNIQNEIKRLSEQEYTNNTDDNVQYDIKTRQRIINKF